MQVPEQDKFHGKLDSKGRVTVPKELRDRWSVSGGDHIEIAILGSQTGGYECDECAETFPIQKVIIRNDGERIVCGNCTTPDDRIV